MKNNNPLLEKSFEFSLNIIQFAEELESKKKYAIANQIIRSGMSIGANIREAQSAESKIDFIHKLKISDKEACETEYWLQLCKHSKNYPNPKQLITDLIEIKKLLSSIISTSKKTLSQ